MNVYKMIPSPLGPIILQANDKGLNGVWFEVQNTQPEHLGSVSADHPILKLASQGLEQYFNKQPITQLPPLNLNGTEFQKKVWNALTDIPFGSSWSYQQLAERINNPKAVRAVGLANSKNPISIFIPCHRVIGKNGKLTGYAGGLDRKEWLLRHENIL